MKLVRLLANLGYGGRRHTTTLLKRGAVTDATGRRCRLTDVDTGGEYFVHGEPLAPRSPLYVALHKPAGVATTRSPDEPSVYSSLPARFPQRRPPLQPVGRLDKDTTGLLLFVDDGTLLHRLTHPRHHVDKDYTFRTARPIAPGAVEQFAAGTLMLRSEATPLLPATLRIDSDTTGQLTLREGRYHQVRRMWAALGNHVTHLHRTRVGPISLGDLPAGAWRQLEAPEVEALYAAVGLTAP